MAWAHGTCDAHKIKGCRQRGCSGLTAPARIPPAARAAPTSSWFAHGTHYAYVKKGCRCPECLPAAPKHTPTEEHGPSAYAHHRCRCDMCREAWNAYIRERYHARGRTARDAVAERAHRRRVKMRGSPSEPYKRQDIYDRDGGKCHICGKRVDPGKWDLDHLDPISLGGADAPWNVAVAHRKCNRVRGNRGPAQLRLIG